MSFIEHQRIVVSARGWLTNMDFTDKEQRDNPAKAALMILKAAYTAVDGGTFAPRICGEANYYLRSFWAVVLGRRFGGSFWWVFNFQSDNGQWAMGTDFIVRL